MKLSEVQGDVAEAPRMRLSQVTSEAESTEPTFAPMPTIAQLPSDAPAALARPTMEQPVPSDPKAVFDQLAKRGAELKAKNIDPRTDPEYRNLARQQAQGQAGNIHQAAGFIGPSEAGVAGLVGRTAQAGPGAIKAAVGAGSDAVRGALHYLWEYQPEAGQKAAQLAEEGYKVGPGAYLKSPRLQRNVDLARQLGYDPLQASAGKMAAKETGKVFQKQGMTPEQSAGEIERLRGMAAIDYEAAGKAIKDTATAEYRQAKGDLATRIADIRQRALEKGTNAVEVEADIARDVKKGVAVLDGKMDGMLKNDWQQVNKLRNAGDLKGLDKVVSEKLWDMHSAIMQHAETRYGLVETLGGDIPIGTRAGAEAAKEFLADIPEEFQKNMPAMTRLLKEFDSGEMTLSRLHFLRSMLRDMGNMNAEKMAPSFRNGPYKYFSKVVDDLIHQENAAPRLKAAIEALDSADEWYAGQAKILRNDLMQQLVDKSRKGFDVDPRAVSRLIVQGTKDDQGLLKQIIEAVGPEDTAKIAAADYSDVLASALEPATGQVNAMKLFEQIDARKNNGSLAILWGKEGDDAWKLSQKLAARAGDIPIPVLPPGQFKEALIRANNLADQAETLAKINPEKIIDDYVKQGKTEIKEATGAFKEARREDILSQFSGPQLMPQEAAREMLRPENVPRLEAAIARWGENSPAVQLLRQSAMEKVFKGAVTKGGEFNAVKEFASLTERQQKLLFPNGLDNDVRTVMENIAFLYGRDTKGIPALAAGSIMDADLSRYLKIYAYRRTMAWIVTHPQFTRLIAGSMRAGGENQREARVALGRIALGMAASEIPTMGAVESQKEKSPLDQPVPQAVKGWKERLVR